MPSSSAQRVVAMAGVDRSSNDADSCSMMLISGREGHVRMPGNDVEEARESRLLMQLWYSQTTTPSGTCACAEDWPARPDFDGIRDSARVHRPP